MLLFVPKGLEATPFPHLKRLKHETIQVAYAPKKAKPLLIPKELKGDSVALLLLDSPFQGPKLVVSYSHIGSDKFDLGLTKFDPTKAPDKQEFYGSLDMGYGGEVYFTGNEFAYTHVNGVSRKYKFTPKTIVEVEQAFIHIGKMRTLRLPKNEHCGSYEGPRVLRLFREQSNKSPAVAVLGLGAEVTVVLREGRWFLIKTPFGLLGWTRVTGSHSLFGFADSCVG